MELKQPAASIFQTNRLARPFGLNTKGEGGCRFVGRLVRVNRQRLGLGGLREMRFLCLGRTVFQALCASVLSCVAL